MDEELRDQINSLIIRLRQGDSDAEKALYDRYVPRIQFYVCRNVWSSDVKDIEDLVWDIWLKLRTWFMRNSIEASEKSVVSNLVRSACRGQARKDKREIAYGEEPYRAIFTAQGNDQDENKEPLLPVLTELIRKRFLCDNGNVNVYEKEKIFEARFKNILSKCLRRRSETQKKVIHLRFYEEYTFNEIAIMLGVATERAWQICNEALMRLNQCFGRYNIRSVGDLL